MACIFSFTISKVIPDKINLNLRSATKINQWENTNDDISLFKSIKSKQSCQFILFDIKDFYPTVAKEILSKSSSFAEVKIQIIEDDMRIYIIREYCYYLTKETRA